MVQTLRMGRWMAEDFERFDRWYGRVPDAVLVVRMRRSLASIEHYALTRFPLVPSGGPPVEWTDERMSRLRRCWGVPAFAVVARVVGVSEADLSAFLSQIQSRALNEPQRSWTASEIRDLKFVYGSRTDESIVTSFGFPLDVIRAQAARLGLRKSKAFTRSRGDSTAMPRWTSAQLDRLRQLYPKCSNVEIAKELGRSVSSVATRAKRLGLSKAN